MNHCTSHDSRTTSFIMLGFYLSVLSSDTQGVINNRSQANVTRLFIKRFYFSSAIDIMVFRFIQPCNSIPMFVNVLKKFSYCFFVNTQAKFASYLWYLSVSFFNFLLQVSWILICFWQLVFSILWFSNFKVFIFLLPFYVTRKLLVLP